MEIETIVDKPVYIEKVVHEDAEMILNTKNENLQKEYN